MEHLGLAMMLMPELASELVRDRDRESARTTRRGGGRRRATRRGGGRRWLRRLFIHGERRAVATVSRDVAAV